MALLTFMPAPGRADGGQGICVRIIGFGRLLCEHRKRAKLYGLIATREARVIKGLHHNAYRCRDSEETRAFYEDFLGLRMVSAFEINEGRALHTFFEMDDGSCLAFFEVPDSPFDFKRQDSLDLHIALGVEPETFAQNFSRTTCANPDAPR